MQILEIQAGNGVSIIYHQKPLLASCVICKQVVVKTSMFLYDALMFAVNFDADYWQGFVHVILEFG